MVRADGRGVAGILDEFLRHVSEAGPQLCLVLKLQHPKSTRSPSSGSRSPSSARSSIPRVQDPVT